MFLLFIPNARRLTSVSYNSSPLAESVRQPSRYIKTHGPEPIDLVNSITIIIIVVVGSGNNGRGSGSGSGNSDGGVVVREK